MRPALLVCAVLAGLASRAQQWDAATAQELSARIDTNGARFAALPSYRWEVRLASYRDATDASPFEEGVSIVLKSGKGSRVDAMGLTTVQNGEHTITVDTADRTILVGWATAPGASLTPGFERLVLKGATVTKMAARDGITYRADFPRGAYYSRVELSYDQQGWMTRMVAYWGFAVQENPDDTRSPGHWPKLVADYARPARMEAERLAPALDLSRYITFTGGRPRAVGAWAAYKLFDTRAQ